MVHLKRVTWKQRRFDDFEILLDISVLSKLTFKSVSAFFGSLSTWQDQVQFGYEMREVEEQVVGGCDLWYFTPTHETQQWPIITNLRGQPHPTRQGRSGSKGAFWTYDVFEALGWVSGSESWVYFFPEERWWLVPWLVRYQVSLKRKRLDLTKSECGKIRFRYWYLLKIVTFLKGCVPFWV